MSLRDELEQLIRWEVSESPAVQRLFKESPESGGTIFLDDDERFWLHMRYGASLRKAILRLADEIDALKLDAEG
jgi:hypothetical protein